MTTGGNRPGAGRNAGYRKEGAARELIAVRLTTEERRIAAYLGDGNASAGIRQALDFWALRSQWYSPEVTRERLSK